MLSNILHTCIVLIIKPFLTSRGWRFPIKTHVPRVVCVCTICCYMWLVGSIFGKQRRTRGPSAGASNASMQRRSIPPFPASPQSPLNHSPSQADAASIHHQLSPSPSTRTKCPRESIALTVCGMLPWHYRTHFNPTLEGGSATLERRCTPESWMHDFHPDSTRNLILGGHAFPPFSLFPHPVTFRRGGGRGHP